MGGLTWWRGAVIYQIYRVAFLDTNGDGVGDSRGIITSWTTLRASMSMPSVSPFFVAYGRFWLRHQ